MAAENQSNRLNILEFTPTEDVFVVKIINDSGHSQQIHKTIRKRFVQMYFSVEGNQSFYFSNGDYKADLQSGGLLALYHPNEDLNLAVNLENKSVMVLLVVSLPRLHQIFAEHDLETKIFESDFGKRYYTRAKFSERIAEVLRNFEVPRLPEKLQNLYVKGKLYELVALYFAENQEASSEFCPYLDHEETSSKLRKARSLMVEDFSNTPTIKELAAKCELSEHKLKEGFKKLYGKSVHRFLIDYKLDLARKRLDAHPEQLIRDLSFEMGYENPSHFIAAFKKRFGLTPLQYSKRLRFV